jgi:hypothetical protein
MPTAIALLGSRGLPAQLPPLKPAERIRVAEALRLGDVLRERVWPGWGAAVVPLLLVTDSVEYLVGHPGTVPGFDAPSAAIGGREVRARPRRFPPTLLATFPVGGVPTAVVGTAGGTGKRSAEWVLSVLHEQFHQWQYARPDYYPRVSALDLAGGDSTGGWMLNYAFPYGRPEVGEAVRRLGLALDGDRGVLPARRALGSLLTPAEERYLEFQLWQEGVARHVELLVARAAVSAPGPAPEFRALPDYEAYGDLASRMARDTAAELRALSLAEHRRLVFYPLGAAMAARLDRLRPDWRRRYVEGELRLDRFLETAER